MHSVLRDNACNIVTTMKECLGCVEHTLELTVNKAALSQRSIFGLIFVLINIMTYNDTHISQFRQVDGYVYKFCQG